MPQKKSDRLADINSEQNCLKEHYKTINLTEQDIINKTPLFHQAQEMGLRISELCEERKKLLGNK